MMRKQFFKSDNSSTDKEWMKLLKKNGYPDHVAETSASKIEHMDPQLREELLRWDKIGDFPTREIEGFTVAGLVENLGMHPIGAFLMMDWLLREPDEAKYALAQSISKLKIDQEVIKNVAAAENVDRAEEG